MIPNIKPSKLTFKNSKNKTNTSDDIRNKRVVSTDELIVESKREKIVSEPSSTKWMQVVHEKDIRGPLFLLQRIATTNNSSKDIYYSLHFQEDGSITQDTFESENGLPEPNNALQIIVGQWMGSDILTLKTPYNKYISSDSHGIITMNREAIGSQEEWIPIFDNNLVSFQHKIFQKFLSYDPNIRTLSADSDNIGCNESFIVQYQEKYNSQISSTDNVSTHSNPLQYELDQIRRYQSWQDRRLRLDTETRDLKKAKDQGKLHESLLERRIKMKSDKYCK